MKTVEKIKQWIHDRNLHTQNPKIQMCKVMEELGELAKAINKNDIDEQIDSIGDTVVTLVCISEQLGLDFHDCINSAYEVIKDRKGQVINGVFVKEEDLICSNCKNKIEVSSSSGCVTCNQCGTKICG